MSLNAHASLAYKIIPQFFFECQFTFWLIGGGYTLIWMGTVWSRQLCFPVKTIGQPIPYSDRGLQLFLLNISDIAF